MAESNEARAPRSRGLRGNRLERVIRHIDAHLDQPMPVAELAALVYQSPFHFSRMFKLATGLSPHQFITLARIDRARELLVETALSCRDVAAATGFGTQSHFTEVFTRWVGVSPERFRRYILRTSANAASSGQRTIFGEAAEAQRAADP